MGRIHFPNLYLSQFSFKTGLGKKYPNPSDSLSFYLRFCERHSMRHLFIFPLRLFQCRVDPYLVQIIMYVYVYRDGSSPPILGGGAAFLALFSRRFRVVSRRFASFCTDFVPFYAVFAAFSVVLRQMVTHYIALNNIYCVFVLFR